MPDDVRGREFAQGVEVAIGKNLVRPPQSLSVRMMVHRPSLLERYRKSSSERSTSDNLLGDKKRNAEGDRPNSKRYGPEVQEEDEPVRLRGAAAGG